MDNQNLTGEIEALGDDNSVNISEFSVDTLNETCHDAALSKPAEIKKSHAEVNDVSNIDYYESSESDIEVNETDSELRDQNKKLEEEKEDTENVIYNRRPLSEDADTYELESFEKNAMIIFNHVKIKGYEPRVGTEKDVEALMATFGKFGFEILERTDLTKDGIKSELKKCECNISLRANVFIISLII